jgi:hypothetical protein
MKGDGKPRLAMRQEVMETLVCFLRTSQAREHSHGPKLSPIHGRLNPSRKRIETRETDVSGIVDVFYIFRSVKVFDFEVGDRAKSRETFRGFPESLGQFLCPPFPFLLDLSKLVLTEHASPSLQLRIANCRVKMFSICNLKFEI